MNVNEPQPNADDDSVEVLRKIEEHLAALRDRGTARARTLLTVQEVADELQVSCDTVERLILTGRLKAAAINGSGNGQRRLYRIRRTWLDEFLKEAIPLHAPTKTIRKRRRPPRFPDFIGD